MEISKTQTTSAANNAITDSRFKLLNMVCATLIHEPRYYSSADEGKNAISAAVTSVCNVDPEFVFKLALYVRDDLNIRSTANYLLALAANNKSCHPFFKKYFSACIRLPNDLLEMVTLFLNLPDRYLVGNGLPTAVRKVIAKKFPEFDVYQLAKYNKERAQKRKTKKQKEPKKSNAMQVDESKPTPLTLKQLIRKVHIAEPAESVMAIVGKKYPMSQEAFLKSGLSGEWQQEKSGKRMKLPIPETWETLVSSKGNKHTTWEELLDHKKLPIMAMLRNLRNMIITGISPAHHNLVLSRLTDERTIANSRQLPWRFLSAYDAINVDLEKLMNDVLDNDGSGEKVIEVKVKGKKGKKMGATRVIKKKVIIPVHMPDIPLIQQYRQAIDTAIRIATMKNLTPIPGKTVVFCDVSGSTKCPCSTRGNMGSLQTVFDISILLGLMIQDSCEDCNYRIFSSPPGTKTNKRCDIEVPLEQNTILDNIKRVTKYSELLGGGTDFPYDYLEELIHKKVKIDNFIIISDMMIAPGRSEMNLRGNTVSSILQKYRNSVNPDLLFVAIDLYGSGKSIVDVNNENPKNILITGFSDNILRFIAENGGKKQLEYVMDIDKVKLTKVTNETKKSKKPRTSDAMQQ